MVLVFSDATPARCYLRPHARGDEANVSIPYQAGSHPNPVPRNTALLIHALQRIRLYIKRDRRHLAFKSSLQRSIGFISITSVTVWTGVSLPVIALLLNYFDRFYLRHKNTYYPTPLNNLHPQKYRLYYSVHTP